MSTKTNAPGAPARGEVAAFSPAPPAFVAMLRDADALLALMGCKPLAVVADLANSLTNSANDAGAVEIAAASNAVRRMVSAREPVALAGPMRDLSDAISRARQAFHLDG
jgi:hypothetical protein